MNDFLLKLHEPFKISDIDDEYEKITENFNSLIYFDIPKLHKAAIEQLNKFRLKFLENICSIKIIDDEILSQYNDNDEYVGSSYDIINTILDEKERLHRYEHKSEYNILDIKTIILESGEIVKKLPDHNNKKYLKYKNKYLNLKKMLQYKQNNNI